VRFVTVGMPGWDTHGNNFGQLRTTLLPELDQALDELSKKSWLIRRGEGDSVSYKVNLRRKASSTLLDSIWSTLDDKIEEQKDEASPEEE
jgi:hypothetical protein